MNETASRIDAFSTYNYFFSFTWGICILLSFIGWGNLLKDILFPDKDIDWGQRAAWGVSLTVFTGGLLNLCRAISPEIIGIWVYAGIGILCFHLFDSQNIKTIFFNIPQKSIRLYKKDKIAYLGILSIIFLMAFYFSTWIVTRDNYLDDIQAYAVFPQKMLEQGSLGNEPFSYGRTTALGGHSFLQALVLSKLQINNLRVIDPGIAYILAFGLLWGLSKSAHVPRRAALCPLFFLLLTPPPCGNIGSLMMGLALFLALFRHFEIQPPLMPKEAMARNLMTALLASAICALKSSLIVFCGAFFVIFYSLRLIFQPSKKNTALECLTVAILTFILLLPWMISSAQSSGTMLYPLLGKGYHWSAYGFIESPPLTWVFFKSIFLKTFFNAATIFVVLLYVINIKKSSKNKIILISAICLSVFSGLLITNILISVIIPRFTFAFFYASLTSLVMYALSENTAAGSPVLKKLSYAAVLLTMVFFLRDYFFESPHQVWQKAKASNDLHGFYSAGKPLSSGDEIRGYSNAQLSIPPGQTVIARCFTPYLLNFKRNPIYIVDHPIAGPKGGMPIFLGGEAVAQYLLSQNIRYVLYSGDDFKKWQNKDLMRRMRSPQEPFFVKQQFLFTLKFQQDLDELEKSRKKIYADQMIAAIDLNETVK